MVNDGIMLVGNPGHLVFNSFEKLPEVSYYWYLPEQFTGDQVWTQHHFRALVDEANVKLYRRPLLLTC